MRCQQIVIYGGPNGAQKSQVHRPDCYMSGWLHKGNEPCDLYGPEPVSEAIPPSRGAAQRASLPIRQAARHLGMAVSIRRDPETGGYMIATHGQQHQNLRLEGEIDGVPVRYLGHLGTIEAQEDK